MNIKNIALVRATNIIPFKGIVKPISEEPYLKKNTATEFGYSISDLLRKNEILQPITFEYGAEEIAKDKEIIKEYIPYGSEYNSMVLWAINGLVPDDSENGFGNNTFSNKKCVIIDGLEEQLKSSNVVSLMPTDTAIKGSVKLSDSAIVLIEQSKYDSLDEEQKKDLSRLNVKTFSGDLRQVVEKTLKETGRYTPERPTLSRSDGGYRKSETSDELIQLINEIARENKILQMYHFDIIMNRFGEVSGELADEFENMQIVYTYYQRQFFEYLSKKMEIEESLAENLKRSPDTKYYIEQLCVEIEKYGIEKYKSIVREYNDGLERLKEKGKLPTPQQIVNAKRKNIPETEEKSKPEGIEIDD